MAAWSCSRFDAAEAIEAVVIAAPPRARGRALAAWRPTRSGIAAHVVPGATAARSRSRALAETVGRGGRARRRPAAGHAELIDRCVAQLERWGCDGVVAAARAVDTIKEADAGGRVIATLEREPLWAVQTPQVFTLAGAARGARRATSSAPTTTRSWWRPRAATCASSRRRART